MRARLLGLLAFALATLFGSEAFAFGQEGHSIVAEIAQHRLSPRAAAEIAHLLGPGRSLASVSSWADDVRDARPGSYRWHFVNIPLDADAYSARRDCVTDPQRGDCIIAELERLTEELRCAQSEEARRDALMYAVHFVGDIHQPLHAVADEQGGNTLVVHVIMRGRICSVPRCTVSATDTNLHAVWDTLLIQKTTWAWGAYVDRLERGWLTSPEAMANGGEPADWALEAHAAAREIWVAPNSALTDEYYNHALPVLDRQLGRAGVRLAQLLNNAYASGECAPVPPARRRSRHR